ncbi:jg5766 [Pararge aegeria aegeria]|uniref:aspartate transaminase n=1 Tax=Pararge aegeria aegeria TaxID=348720 RepID=A0A8S4SNI7_9NEOP|nr:jg5766 [Pararge aegeria aegeria]
MGSRFQVVEQGPPIEVFQLNKLFTEDTFKNKVNLGVGAYRDENGKPWVLPIVRKMEKKMADDDTLLHEYLPVLENHHLVFVNSGFTQPRTYRYWDEKARAIDFDGLIEDLSKAPENSVVILHACAHNPTGIDPTQEQWQKIADVMEVGTF